MSKMIQMKSHVVTCHKRRSIERHAILTGPLYSQCIFTKRKSNSDNKVLTIAFRYTAASVFRLGDSRTLFRGSVSAFLFRSAWLSASKSFGYSSRWGNADTRFRWYFPAWFFWHTFLMRAFWSFGVTLRDLSLLSLVLWLAWDIIGHVVSGKSAPFSFIVSISMENDLLVLDCNHFLASVTCFSRQGQDVRMNNFLCVWMNACAAVLFQI